MARLPPLNALKCFEAAARSQSFSKAADELHVTQSAISHQIRQLEQWFGVTLFDRLGRQTVPTPKGYELAQALAESFEIIGKACKRIVQSDQGPPLTIGVLPSIATIWLIPRLSHFFRSNPDIPVKVIYAFHGQSFNFDEVNIAILWGTGQWPEGRLTRFLEGATIAVCNSGFYEKEGPLSTPEFVAQKPLLHDTDRQGWQIWLRKSGLGYSGPAPGPIFEDFNLLRAAALAGQGIALCPKSLVVDDLASGRLIQLSEVTINEDHAYYIIEPTDTQHRHAAAISLFKDWLLGQANSNNPTP